MLLSPHQFFIGFCRYCDEDGHIKEVFIVVGNALLDVVAGLNGVCKLLVIRACILHTLDFGTVESDTLCNLINGFTSVFTAQKDINVNAFAGIDQRTHPTGTHSARIAITLDEKEGVIKTIHNHVVVMLQVNTPWSDEVRKPNVRYFINADNLIFRCHSVNNHSFHPGREWLIHTGTTVKEHI